MSVVLPPMSRGQGEAWSGLLDLSGRLHAMLSWLLDWDERRALVRYRAIAVGRARARDVDDRDELRARWASTDSRPDVRAVVAYLDGVVDRELGLKVHDEQWVAVLALLDGKAAQLDTGEGTHQGLALARVQLGRFPVGQGQNGPPRLVVHLHSEFAIHNPVEIRHDRAHVRSGIRARPTGSELIAIVHIARTSTTYRNRAIPDQRAALIPVKKPAQHGM